MTTANSKLKLRHLRKIRTLNLLALLCLSALAGQAQSIPDSNPQKGLSIAGTYTIDKLQTIDRVNGNVMYHIPLVRLPKVGPDDPFQLELIYNSQNLVASYTYVTDTRLGPNQYMSQATLGGGDGWTFNASYSVSVEGRSYPGGSGPPCPNPGAYKIYRVILKTPDGAQHSLNLYGESADGGEATGGYYDLNPFNGYRATCNGSGGSSTDSGPFTYFTNDGSYLKVTVWPGAALSSPSSWTISYPTGTVVAGDSQAGMQSITDRNGNVTTMSADPDTKANAVISNAAGSIRLQTTYANGTPTTTVTAAGFGVTQ